MTDILLTHSYFLRFDPKQFKTMMPYPPLGTLYAASYLRQQNFSVSFFDSMFAESEEEFRVAMVQHRPRIVAVYDDDFNYLTKMCLSRMREAAFRIIAIAKEYNAFVIVHSSDSADNIEKYISQSADVIIVGEGEQTLLEICESLLSRRSRELSSIAGIAFISEGKTHRTSKREVVKNLDSLPFPAWDLVDIERYRFLWKKHHGYFSLNMVTTRGCPFHCNWCAKPIYGQVYNSRTPQNVIDEMTVLKATVKPDHIWFADDIFGLKRGWVKQFSELVQKEKLTLPFTCLSRADLLLHDDTIRSLKAANCETVWLGAESGSQKILDAMEKGITIYQISESAHQLRTHNISVGFFLQFGYLGEERRDIEATLKMVRECKPDEIGISVSYPLPGTKFFKIVQNQLSDKHNWVDSDDLDMMFAGRYTQTYYRTLHAFVHKDFQLHRAFRFLRQLISFQTLSRRKIRTVSLLPYYTITKLLIGVRLKMLERIPNPRTLKFRIQSAS